MTRITSTEGVDSDWALLNRVVARDESALASLYDRYGGMVYSQALRITRRPTEAEEILHDIFFQIWRTADRFNPQKGSLPGWLLVAARHRAISRLRSEAVRPAQSIEENGVNLAAPMDSDASRGALLERVKTAMGSLSADQRAAVELAYFEGMTHHEIADRLGEPLGTVKSRIRSAMEMLKRVLS